MTLDVLRVVYRHNVNIAAMEVSPGRIHLKIHPCSGKVLEHLLAGISNLEGVIDKREIKLMPHEERERQLKAVMDSVDEGIVAVDSQGKINIFNPSAEKILKFKAEEVMGRPVSEVLSPDIPMMISLGTGEGYDNEEIMLRTERGVSHYITTGRPIKDENNRIVGAVALIKDINRVLDLVYSMTSSPDITFDDILGVSEGMEYAKNVARMVAVSSSTVLIRGESGTGKELFARSIHRASRRKDRHFVPVNCGALPDTLLESELFGYEEGAFTGARKGGKQGLFRFADGGTLFLDEIGELSPHLQVKLLRVLQEGKVRRIGGAEEIRVDVRVVAATSRNLEEMLEQGLFRDDLYYRLNVVPLFVPPLRRRKEDIPILVEHFINQVSVNMGKSIKGITRQALEKLTAHHWPGNVRELSNVIERAINLVHGGYIEEKHIVLDTRLTGQNGYEGVLEYGKGLREILGETERRILTEAVKRLGSSRKVGAALGISHTAVIKKMKKYNIKP
ncbi:MAG: sigma 54-interacting transcriptional regulator [Clostridiales bacterium]|nr:sigma 54-interacting transcriptional regulator [Clostridiales bacterium]